MTFNIQISNYSDLNKFNDIGKGTSKYRMKKADKMIVDHFIHIGKSKVDFLDIAASSCITTLDLHKKFIESGVKIKTTATDLSLYLYHFPVGLFNVLVDKNGYIFQYYFGKYLIKYPYRRLFRYLGFQILYNWIASRVQKNKKEILKSNRICLVDNAAREIENFSYLEDNATILNEGLVRKFNFARIAHCLCQFIDDEDAFNAIVRNMKQYLSGKNSHLLILSQEENGTLFECDKNGDLNVSLRIGTGYQFEKKILDL